MRTKRICDLLVGDVFFYDNIERIVYSLSENRVKYRSFMSNPQGCGRGSFGDKNKMKVEYVTTVEVNKRVTLPKQKTNG